MGPYNHSIRVQRPLQITEIIEPIVVFMNIRVFLIFVLNKLDNLHTTRKFTRSTQLFPWFLPKPPQLSLR